MATGSEGRWSQYFIAAVITFVAMTIAVTHVIKDGAAIDAVIVWLLLIAIFPWAGGFVKTFEIFGIKGELLEFQKKLDELSGTAQDANQMSAVAAAGVGKALAEQVSGTSARAELYKLAEEYIATRKRMKAGSDRTSEMSSIFSKMAALAVYVEGISIREELINNDAGHRLVGYAYLYSRPDSALLDTLVESVTEFENQPFGQYWGIKAIGKVLNITRAIPPEIIPKLQVFLGELNKGTDRHFALSKILDELPKGKTARTTVAL